MFHGSFVVTSDFETWYETNSYREAEKMAQDWLAKNPEDRVSVYEHCCDVTLALDMNVQV